MSERRNDLEIVKGRAIKCAIQLGSISSLRCQKSRNPDPGEDRGLRSDVSRTDGYGFDSPSSPIARQRRAQTRLRATPGTTPRPSGPCVAAPRVARRAKRGGARRDRTDDLMLAKHALSQLSYGPVSPNDGARFRPFRLRRARLASFAGVAAPRVAEGEAWWAWEDLNFRPHAYQARALTN
jgi:hypothetical protein